MWFAHVLFTVVAVFAQQRISPVLWSGGLSPTSVHIVARTFDENVSLTVRRNDVNDDRFVWKSIGESRSSFDESLRHYFFDDLVPDAAYDYFLDSRSDNVGTFRTPSNSTQSANFSFVVSACSDTGANFQVYNALTRHIQENQSLFYLMTGDIAYADIASNSSALYHAMFNQLFTLNRQAAVFRSTPLVYVWCVSIASKSLSLQDELQG